MTFVGESSHCWCAQRSGLREEPQPVRLRSADSSVQQPSGPEPEPEPEPEPGLSRLTMLRGAVQAPGDNRVDSFEGSLPPAELTELGEKLLGAREW